MRLLVKVGGTLLDTPETRGDVAGQLAGIARHHELVVVHGGGKQMTRFLEERGLKSRFVNGLRISDENVIDAACKVIAGSVNKLFVSALSAAGQYAVGISGVDGRLTDARQMEGGLGFVGKPLRSNGHLLSLLSQNGFLPVVACIAGDGNGTIFNVNADQMAVSCAAAFQAEMIVFLTDVPGVKDSTGQFLAELDPTGIADLIRSGVVFGGMQAKLEAAMLALENGVRTVQIASGNEANVVERLVAGEQVGTQISRLFGEVARS